LWDLGSGKVWQTLDDKKASRVTSAAFSPTGAVLAIDCAGLRPPSVRLWDISKRPGGSAVASLPPARTDQPTADDLLAAEIEMGIRRNFDPRNIESLEVTVLPDGTIKLTGKVSADEVKRVAGRHAEVHRASEDVGPGGLNKVINELEVTGRLAPNNPRGTR
jgi:hypothetical protein